MDLNYAAILPEIILSITGVVVMLLIPAGGPGSGTRLGLISTAGIGAALATATAQWGARSLAFGDMVYQDSFAQFSKAILLLAAAAVTLLATRYLAGEQEERAEFYCLVLFATVGMCLMACSADLIMTFLGLETLSIATYVLAGYRRGRMQSTEAALKYFILGAFATAFLLYGIALVYGVAGSTKYGVIASSLADLDRVPGLLLAGLGLMIVGFAFKIALAPFHVWTPDVYQGAPLPVTAYLAVASKAAAAVALLRVLFQALPSLVAEWSAVLWLLAVVTIFIGNLAALVQTNIKRMLAYSSIAHAGYLMIGFAAHSSAGAQGVLFYLLAYSFMNIGAFAVIGVLAREQEARVHIEDYAGLGLKSPFLGIAMAVFMVSLAGIPLTAGFTGKLFLLAAAVESGLYWLVFFAVVGSAIGVYYYLRVLVVMFMQPSAGSEPDLGLPLATGVVIVIMLVGTLYLGVLPGRILQLASEAVRF